MNPENRTLYRVDALALMERLDSGLFTLVYIDPPWGINLTSAADIQRYRRFISRVAQQSWRLLHQHGSLYVQVPPTSPVDTDYRLLVNQSVGQPPSSVVTWKYPRVTNMPCPRDTHDEILRYNKSPNSVYNVVALPPDLTRYRQRDDRGPFILCDLTTTGLRPSRVYEWRGHYPPEGRAWCFLREQMDQYFADGRIVEHGRLPRLKRYADESLGKDVGTVWDDIPPHRQRGIRLAGAKPPDLCARIIRQATNVGDRVFDPMCGSGQMLVQAELLGRLWCGNDSSPEAIDLTTELWASTATTPGVPDASIRLAATPAAEPVWAAYQDVFLSVDELAGARRKLAKLTEFMSVLKQELASEARSDDDIIEALQGAIPGLRWLVNDDARASGADAIRKKLPSFDSLEPDSRDFLITAHVLLDMLPDGLDFSVVSVSAWKTVENEIGAKLFRAFKTWIASSARFASSTFAVDLSDRGPRKLLVKYLLGEGKPFTLGCLDAVRGIYDKAKPEGSGDSVSDALYAFINGAFIAPDRIVGDGGVATKITPDVVDQYRNGAAHDTLVTRGRATESVKFVLGLLPTVARAFEKRTMPTGAANT